MEIHSRFIKQAVEELSRLPSIGSKSALRLVLHMLQQPKDLSLGIANSLKELRENVKSCSKCHYYSDQEICEICKDNGRLQDVICVVESAKDVMAIEQTNQFKGIYHVLGGVLSPIDGIEPEDLNLNSLISKAEQCREIIFALSPTIEGETTMFYIRKIISIPEIEFTVLARGISFGGELEYADEFTLGRSITSRIPFDSTS